MKYYSITTALCLTLATGAVAQEGGMTDDNLAALDADGDASVSKEEFDNFSRFAFGAIDVDKNGAISLSEAMAHVDEDRFRVVDANGDGTVSEAEFMARMNANFEAADKDGNGQLN